VVRHTVAPSERKAPIDNRYTATSQAVVFLVVSGEGNSRSAVKRSVSKKRSGRGSFRRTYGAIHETTVKVYATVAAFHHEKP